MGPGYSPATGWSGEGWSRGLRRYRRESLCHLLLIPIQDSSCLLLLLIGRLSPLLLGRKGNFFRNPQSKGENSLPVLDVLRERNVFIASQ